MHKFKDNSLFQLALTHRSYVHEHKQDKLNSNERLEFLGDAVLELWTTQTLYEQFPEFDEGKLTNLRSLIVCTASLAQIAKNLSLDQKLLLSHGEEQNGGRGNSSLLADTFEAVLGAVYSDAGWTAVNKFLEENLSDTIQTLANKKHYKDPKSHFQELVQAKDGITPHYITLNESGPDHKKIFQVAVLVGKEEIAQGQGNSKQAAETEASLQAIQIYESRL